MGTYLATGIVEQISVGKKQIKYPDVIIDKIIECLMNEINLDCYSFSENLDGYYWKIKPEMLEGNLVEFLTTQFHMYNGKTDNDMEKAISLLKETNGAKEIIELAESKFLINFQMIDQIIEYISIKKDNGFEEHIMLSYSLMSYFIDGKILTEGLGNSLRYFEENIRLQKEQYPIANCVKVMVTS